MDRVTGWYKRYTQKWLFCLAFFLAVGCNVDTIHIVQTLSANPTLAAEVAGTAAKYAHSQFRPLMLRLRQHLRRTLPSRGL